MDLLSEKFSLSLKDTATRVRIEISSGVKSNLTYFSCIHVKEIRLTEHTTDLSDQKYQFYIQNLCDYFNIFMF